MLRASVEQWLTEHGITLGQGFVLALKDYAWAYKKRPASAWPGYTVP